MDIDRTYNNLVVIARDEAPQQSMAMKRDFQPAAYIMASARNGTLYVGVRGRVANAVEQVPPLWVELFYQRQFALARPAFDLFLAADRIFHRRVELPPDEKLASVALGEIIAQCLAMLPSALGQSEVTST